jgi:hypothetical protein
MIEKDRDVRRQRRSALVALAAAVLVNCPAAGQDIDSSRSVWRAASMADYEYSYQRVCECHPEESADTIVTVREGVVVGVRYARPGYDEQVALEPEKFAWYRTIDDLFSLVATAEASAATVRVTYDVQLGFPRSIYIDYVTDLVGDEVELMVTRFDALE